MKDLTQGSIPKALLTLAGFMAISMVFQTMYFLADLYWVGRLGKDAVAAVSLAGNLMFIVLALTQTLGVGTTTLISHAAGQKDIPRIGHIFNQSMVLSQLVGIALGVIAFLLRGVYSRTLAADAATAQLSETYLAWFIPAMAFQFTATSVGSALRGIGIMKPTMIMQVVTVALNIVLAPIMIFGWGTGHPMGVAGAAASTFIAVILGSIGLLVYVAYGELSLRFDSSEWRPDFATWGKMLRIGIPAGSEFLIISVYIIVVYWIIRGFGSAAQAGFGIGGRIMQAMFMPVVAIAFAAAPVAGQNFGARNADRVRQTFYSAAMLASVIMFTMSVLCQISPQTLIHIFSKDPAVVQFGSDYLRIISWNFVASGLVFTSSSIFQGLGNTVPPLLSSVTRLVLFAIPAALLSTMPGFRIQHVWYMSLATVVIQAAITVWLLHREFEKRLSFAEQAVGVGASESLEPA